MGKYRINFPILINFKFLRTIENTKYQILITKNPSNPADYQKPNQQIFQEFSLNKNLEKLEKLLEQAEKFIEIFSG